MSDDGFTLADIPGFNHRELVGRVEFCKECEVQINLRYCAYVNKQLLEAGLCHNCEHWAEKIRWATEPSRKDRVVRVNHQHFLYRIEDPSNPTPPFFRGFGGRAFRINFFDGRSVMVNNLWHQGNIPPRFWDRLPDNAEFIYENHPSPI